ncbi:phytanoyl-CoA dioxygenase family protein [Psychrosphaera sp. F3M07]|uniref:phytanoyl-CoA dioxygenase family protein n=1 Tax=Psychrosphaera sp. F3M07 TaxID=2841560 RepID=UPI001C08ACA0|nr:phytanoyl-CoA dioxygenase family protein [Psychrosphaera sp. F3M07]MBU2917454.1 phytanoyl-CoA dioxygenase family protein [Psychrosphaera sp. F3M07]
MNIGCFKLSDFADSDKIIEIKSEFVDQGIVKVSGLFNEAQLEQPIQDLLAVISDWSNTTNLPNDPDEAFNLLCKNNVKSADIALRIAKDLPSFQSLISNQNLHSVIGHLLGEKYLLSPFDWSLFRIDGESTKVSHFEWHQDYQYNVISTNAVTFWIALRDVEHDMGPLKFVPKSHNKIHAIHKETEVEANNPNRIRIVKNDEFEQLVLNQTDAGVIKKGECILFNTLLLHASGINKSEKYRWVANGRYAPANDKELMARDFYMARTKYPRFFESAHQDLVN